MPKVVDHDARRKTIAEAAWNVINSVGVERITLMEIAKEAGFTTGSLVHYFRFKEEVVEFAYAEAERMVGRDIAADCADLPPGMDRLRATLLGVLPTPKCAYKKANFRLCQWIPANAPKKLVRRYREMYGGWRNRIMSHLKEAVASNQLANPTDVERDIDLLITFVDGVCFNMLADPRRATLDRETEFVDQMLFRLLDWSVDSKPRSKVRRGAA